MNTTIQIPAGVSVDPYLKANRDPGTVFRLEAGRYTTQGCFAFPEFDLCMLAPDCSIVADVGAVLAIEDPALEYNMVPTGYTEVLTAGARTTGYSSAIAITDLMIDCHLEPRIPVVGVHAWTSDATLKVTVTNVFGDRDAKTSVREGFGVLVNSSAQSKVFDGGHSVQCFVHLADTAKENYSTAVFVGCWKAGVPLLRSTIRNSVVIAADGHAAYAMNDRVDLINCEATGFRRAVFVDTGPVQDCRIERLDADRCGWALDLRGTSPRRGILAKDSHFNFRSIDGWAQALLLSDDESGATIDGVVLDGCSFVAPSNGRASKARLRGKNVAPFIERNSTWTGAWESPVVQKPT